MPRAATAAAIAVAVTLLLAVPLAAAAEQVQAGTTGAAQVMVTNVTVSPEVFMPGDSGTITVEVVNNGAQSVAIRRATLYDEKIRVASLPYETTMYLGAGNRMRFTFTVRASVPEGIYYPVFSLDFRDAGYLRYPVKLRVQDQPLALAVLSKPDVFEGEKREKVEILVGNPRDNTLSGITVTPTGEGIDATPSQAFVGSLAPDQSQKVTFLVTPRSSATLEFRADYYNGINPHTEAIRVPVTVGRSKLRAEPVISNVRVERSGTTYTLTGDVTNAGLEPANAVIVTVGEGAVPRDPYRQYVVGTLQPDDFAGFEVTFSAAGNETRVPVVVTHKDTDGNTYTTVFPVDLPAAGSRAEGEGPGQGFPYLVAGVIAASAAVVCGAVWYSWRRR
ncbi:MAG: hypothetical protein QFX32_04840 [Methanolinea sp.]|nr:hypothetical protein [Methanolinea sp.]